MKYVNSSKRTSCVTFNKCSMMKNGSIFAVNHHRSEIASGSLPLEANVPSNRLVATFRLHFVFDWKHHGDSHIKPLDEYLAIIRRAAPAFSLEIMKLLAVLCALMIRCAASKSWNNDSKVKALYMPRHPMWLSSLPVRLFGGVLRV